jgi:enoyl-CoA hydratase/carnithine racemase
MTIHRPEKRNALSPDCLQEMTEIFRNLSEKDEIRTVVIRGSGEEAFSSGYDVTALPTGSAVGQNLVAAAESPLDLAVQAIRTFPYPVIAMINGYAYGGGCELAVSCDIRIAADNVRMGVPAAKLGVVYRPGGLRLFLTVIGFSRTLEILLTGRSYDSESCLRMGLVNHVVPMGGLETFTYGMAREIAENAPLSIKGTKFAMNQIVKYPLLPKELEDTLSSLRREAFQSEDIEEGKRALREKRKPRFIGR